MREWQSQARVRWYCRYHIVVVLKYRKKSIYGVLRKDIGPILKELCRQFGVELIAKPGGHDYSRDRNCGFDSQTELVLLAAAEKDDNNHHP